MGLELLDLPDLPLAKIFSFLPMEDLKQVRLVSNRLSEEVLKLDKRFDTWRILTFRDGLPQHTHKVSQFNLKIELVVDDSDEEEYRHIFKEKFDPKALEPWMIKHSSSITRLFINMNLNLDQMVLRLISDFTQLRRLELENASNDLVKNMLSRIGPQLDLLAFGNSDNDETDFSYIDVSGLKYLMMSCETNSIHSFLRIVPCKLKILDLSTDSEYVELPTTMNQLCNLETLRIGPCKVFDNSRMIPALTTHLISTSLTRLYLNCIKLKNLEPVDTDLPVLEVIGLLSCSIDMIVLKNLLMKCSKSLKVLLNYEPREINGNEDLDFKLPELTTAQVTGVGSQLICMSSKSLTTLKICFTDLSILGEIDCDLPALKALSIEHCDCSNISNFLRKCSSSLQIIHLLHLNVRFEVEVPNLRELYLEKTTVEGFTNLVDPSESMIENIGLREVEGSIWEDIVGYNFPRLQDVQIQNLTEEQEEKVMTCLKTADVTLYHDCRGRDWRVMYFRHFKPPEFIDNWYYLTGVKLM